MRTNIAIAALSIFMNAAAIAQIFPHYSIHARSTGELTQHADAVVRGHIQQKQFKDEDPAFKLSMTEYRLRVTDVLKSDGQVRVGDVIAVYRFAGVQNGKPNVEQEFAPFEISDDLIVFLDWASVAKVYLPFLGPDGAYRIVNGRARPFGKSQAAKLNEGKDVAQLLAEIKKVKK